MNLRFALASLAAAGLLAAPSALAAGAAPTDAEVLGAQPVGVLPVLATGLSAEGAWTRVAAAIGSGAHAGAAPGRVDAQLGEGGGFGFAGSATAEDVRVLRYGYYLGMMPALIESGHAERGATRERLLMAIDALATLSPATQKAAREALASADTLDAAAFGRVLAAAQAGIASGDARRHGYLAAGVWCGLAHLAVWQGRADEALLGMAGPLMALLNEDAAFGGADRQVAALMKRLAAELSAPAVVGANVEALGGQLLAIELDASPAR